MILGLLTHYNDEGHVLSIETSFSTNVGRLGGWGSAHQFGSCQHGVGMTQPSMHIKVEISKYPTSSYLVTRDLLIKFVDPYYILRNNALRFSLFSSYYLLSTGNVKVNDAKEDTTRFTFVTFCATRPDSLRELDKFLKEI